MDLSEFLAARLDEKARDAEDFHDVLECATAGPVSFPCDCGVPVRVLREVEAHREILDLHAPCYPVTYPEPSGQPTCGVCHAGGWEWDPEEWPCPTVRLLAAVYSDHPDYREEWKP